MKPRRRRARRNPTPEYVVTYKDDRRVIGRHAYDSLFLAMVDLRDQLRKEYGTRRHLRAEVVAPPEGGGRITGDDVVLTVYTDGDGEWKVDV